MRTLLVSPALTLVREAGVEARVVAELLTRFELPQSAELDAEVVMPVARLASFLDEAASLAKDPFLGLRIAARYRRGMYGLTEFALRTSATLGEACQRLERYVALLNELVEISVVAGDGHATIEQKIPGVRACVGRHGNEFFVCAMTLHARALTGVPLVPLRAHFAHGKPRDVSELESLLGTRALTFGAGANGLVFPASALQLAVLSSDPPLSAILESQAEQSLKARTAPSRFLGRVRASVHEALTGGAPTVLDVARRLKMSSRTLQRRLGADGSTFQQVVDSVREETARAQVLDGKRSLTDVALGLGYADQSAFLRAFKRWTGMTPAEARRRS